MVSKTHLKLDIKHWLTCITNGTSVDSIDLVVISNDKSLNVIVGSVIFPIWNDADDGDGDDSWGDGVGDGVNRLNVVVVVIIAVVVCAVVDIVDFVVINEHAVVVVAHTWGVKFGFWVGLWNVYKDVDEDVYGYNDVNDDVNDDDNFGCWETWNWDSFLDVKFG